VYVQDLSSGGEKVLLRNGYVVLIRPVRPSDADLLLAGFARLSLRSRYARFLTAKTELTPDEVRYFTHVDHYDHDAVGAIDPLTGRGVGIARFVRSGTETQDAEVAITVVDEWQRRGVGTALLTRLAERARRVGIFSFTAVVAADNVAMIGLLRRGHPGIELTGVDGDVLEYAIALGSFTGRLTA
jgi:GNAT superfamily N-acetyltransferase